MLEAKAKGFEYKISKGQNSNVQKIFNDVISARLDILRQQNITILKSKAKIIAGEKGINLVTASSEFHGSQMIAEYSQNPKQYINDDENIIESNQSLSRKRRDVEELPLNHRTRNIKRQKDPSEEIPAYDDESDNESIISNSQLHNEFVWEMKMADETEEYYSDPESTESVNDDDDDYVYSSGSSFRDSFDNDNTVVDDSKLKTKIEFTEFENLLKNE
ncbi:hypothetical protein RclHR1_03690012 [Rhizophagus clarus]|uniref:Uncharacterized protein n=1 Tax=Rhizophagus clarus TaxID=94130 RepID=A0A2Z6RSH5_9GLOM|nr:hypothetical protein RclHR1_03690012 [Rhizophagus clarus]